jgi:hypothetical protein
MLIRKPDDVASSEITGEGQYLNRRKFMVAAGTIGAACAGGLLAPGLLQACGGEAEQGGGDAARYPTQQGDKLNSYEDITSYNNFYEFGTDKTDPKENAHTLRTRPWTVQVAGLVKKPATYHFEDLVKPHKLEDRVYRLRCVEAWSMVIPWQGIPLAEMTPEDRQRQHEDHHRGAERAQRGVLVEVLEGMADEWTWDFIAPMPSERFTQRELAFVELPKKYTSHGVIDDRSSPFVLWAHANVDFPAGKQRLLLRSRSAAPRIPYSRPKKARFSRAVSSGYSAISCGT